MTAPSMPAWSRICNGAAARVGGWDRRVVRWTHGVRAPALTFVMAAATVSGTAPVWVVAAAMLTALHTSGHCVPLTDRFLRAMLASAVAWLAGNVLRLLVRRPRPFRGMADHDALIPPPPGASMPSTHAATSIGLGVALLAGGHPAGWPVLVWAVLVVLSRLYLGVHYPSDLLVGAAVGVGCGVALSGWV